MIATIVINISVVPIAPSTVVFMLIPSGSSQLRFKLNPGFVNNITHAEIVSTKTIKKNRLNRQQIKQLRTKRLTIKKMASTNFKQRLIL